MRGSSAIKQEGRFSRYNLLELMIPSTDRPGSSKSPGSVLGRSFLSFLTLLTHSVW